MNDYREINGKSTAISGVIVSALRIPSFGGA